MTDYLKICYGLLAFTLYLRLFMLSFENNKKESHF